MLQNIDVRDLYNYMENNYNYVYINNENFHLYIIKLINFFVHQSFDIKTKNIKT